VVYGALWRAGGVAKRIGWVNRLTNFWNRIGFSLRLTNYFSRIGSLLPWVIFDKLRKAQQKLRAGHPVIASNDAPGYFLGA
jgi:hypothetical protein